MKDIKSGKEFYIVKKSYNLGDLNDQKWYLRDSQDLFDESIHVLDQLEEIRAGNDIQSEFGAKIYNVITVGR